MGQRRGDRLAESCASCGETLSVVEGACDGCHFVYCVEHADTADHECLVICAECPDEFDEWYWAHERAAPCG